MSDGVVERVEQVIDAFTWKHGMMQDADVDQVEQSEFSSASYRAMDGKTFVSVCSYFFPRADESKAVVTVVFGKLRVLVENVDEEEWFFLEKDVVCDIALVHDDDWEARMESLCRQNKLLLPADAAAAAAAAAAADAAAIVD